MNDKTNAPTPARTVQVCPDCGSRDAQVTAWIDANTSELMDDEGPLGGAWCPVCETDDHALIEVPYCVACDAKGWEVFDRDNTREVQRCKACARLDSNETAARLAFGAGLQVAHNGEVKPDAEEHWRTDYRTLRGLTRTPSAGPLKLGHIAYAIAERIAHTDLGSVIEGVRAGEHRHRGSAGQDAFDLYVDDHGTRRRFAIAVFSNDHPDARPGRAGLRSAADSIIKGRTSAPVGLPSRYSNEDGDSLESAEVTWLCRVASMAVGLRYATLEEREMRLSRLLSTVDEIDLEATS